MKATRVPEGVDGAKLWQVSRPRQLCRTPPGYWILTDLGPNDVIWCSVEVIMETEHVRYGRLVRMSLHDPLGETAENKIVTLVDKRTEVRTSVTAAQAARYGLKVDDRVST
jgi:hypothetical protein